MCEGFFYFFFLLLFFKLVLQFGCSTLERCYWCRRSTIEILILEDTQHAICKRYSTRTQTQTLRAPSRAEQITVGSWSRANWQLVAIVSSPHGLPLPAAHLPQSSVRSQMLIAAALWSKWHFAASTTTTTIGSSAALLHYSTLDMANPLPVPLPLPLPLPLQLSLSQSKWAWPLVRPSPTFVANVCGFEFKLKQDVVYSNEF